MVKLGLPQLLKNGLLLENSSMLATISDVRRRNSYEYLSWYQEVYGIQQLRKNKQFLLFLIRNKKFLNLINRIH